MKPDVGKAIYTILTSASAVTSIVGTKIYPRMVAQETAAPFIVYHTRANVPLDTKDRPSPLDTVRVQFDIVTRTYAQAQTLHDAIRTAIDAYTIGSTVSGVTLDGVKFDDEEDEMIEEVDLHVKVAEYTFRIKY